MHRQFRTGCATQYILIGTVKYRQLATTNPTTVWRFEGQTATALASLHNHNPNLTVDDNFLTLATL
jgi:hypothetical protein